MKSFPLRLIIGLLAVASVTVGFDSEGRSGESAEVLVLRGGLSQMRVSPTGDWIIATGVFGESRGILVQSTATGETANVFSTRIPMRSIDWIGRDAVKHYQVPFPFSPACAWGHDPSVPCDETCWEECVASLGAQGIQPDRIAGIIGEAVPGWATAKSPSTRARSRGRCSST